MCSPVLLAEGEVMSAVDLTLLLRASGTVDGGVRELEVGASGEVKVCVRGGATTPELFPLT